MRENSHGRIASENAKEETVLGRCLVEGDSETTASERRRRRKTFGVSLVLEFLLLGLLLAIPLFSSVARPQLRRDPPTDITFIRGRHVHNPIQHMHATAAEPPRAVNWRPTLELPGARRPEAQRVEENGNDEGTEISGIVEPPGGIEVTEINRPPFVRHAEPPTPQEKRPVKVSEGVLQAQLISRIEPRYPPLGVQLKMEGTVVLHAIIGRDGRISALEVVSGSPFFVQAALDAVRQWRYRPTMLNGEPVEVDTTITVMFRLHH
jgi:protein TonB